MMMRVFIYFLLINVLALVPVRADTATVQIAWRLLDYIAVDYPGAVRDGKIVSQTEFAEMTEFAASAHHQIAELPASATKAELQSRAAALQRLIAAKATGEQVATTARSLAVDLLSGYPVPLVPVQSLDFDRGRELFAQSCVSCHGEAGDGRGPAAANLLPPPTDFTDRERARERSVFALKQVIDQGVPGTGMVGFATLPQEDRWDLALYVSGFAYPTDRPPQGKRIWDENTALRADTDLLALINTTPAMLAADIGDTSAAAVTAYLRHHPAEVLPATTSPLALTRTRLTEMMAAYAEGDDKGATNLALSAYLDGFEPAEPILSMRDPALLRQIETAMAVLRADLARDRPLAEVQTQTAALCALVTEAEAALAPRESSAVSSFFGAFTILLREGLESLLIVVTMLAFLRQTDRDDARSYVHGGWVTALVAGILTWVAATYFIKISGASRELTEGFGSIFAAGVLVWVGVWMHGKSNAKAWQDYICDKLRHVPGGHSPWLLFGLSFLVVYREVFETILFYAAIWHHGDGGMVLTGGVTAVTVLIVITWAMIHYSRTMPIARFFAYSSALVAVLAVVLIGKGVNGLQEAGRRQAASALSFDIAS